MQRTSTINEINAPAKCAPFHRFNCHNFCGVTVYLLILMHSLHCFYSRNQSLIPQPIVQFNSWWFVPQPGQMWQNIYTMHAHKKNAYNIYTHGTFIWAVKSLKNLTRWPCGCARQGFHCVNVALYNLNFILFLFLISSQICDGSTPSNLCGGGGVFTKINLLLFVDV